MSDKLWAIGDIHGMYDQFQALMDKLLLDGEADLKSGDKIIFLGDYVDRGPDSAGVLAGVRGLTELYPDNVVALYGNHEDLMYNAVKNPMLFMNVWKQNGGNTTHKSFKGVKPPQAVLNWLYQLPLYHYEPGFFFSHAPVGKWAKHNASHGEPPFSKTNLIWDYPFEGYEEFRHRDETGDAVGVCGHNHDMGEGNVRFYDHYIYCDSGAGCFDGAPLSAVEVRTRKVIQVFPEKGKA